MLHIDNFIKYIIGTFFTLILIMNIIYAFNLVGTLGVPFAYQTNTDDFSYKFFGISNIIDSFKSFFGNNVAINQYQSILSFWYNLMRYVDLNNVLGMTDYWGGAIDSGNWFTQLASGLLAIFNLLVNVPYTLMMVIYFLLFLFYVLMLIFIFISYACYLLSGVSYSYMPDTYGMFSTISQYILFH